MISMDPATAFSVVGVICVVLFNVYEFRKVGSEIGKIGEDVHKSHEELVKALRDLREQIHRDHREMREQIHRDHREIVNLLKSATG